MGIDFMKFVTTLVKSKVFVNSHKRNNNWNVTLRPDPSGVPRGQIKVKFHFFDSSQIWFQINQKITLNKDMASTFA